MDLSDEQRRELRAVARATGKRYTQLLREQGLLKEPPGELVSALDRLIRARLEKLEEVPMNPAGLASRLAASLAKLKINWVPREANPNDDRWDLADAITIAVCDGLRGWSPPSSEEFLKYGGAAWERRPPVDRRAHVAWGELWDASVAVLGDVGPLLVEEPSGGYGYAFGVTVEDYLAPPSDGDFEYFNEDSSD